MLTLVQSPTRPPAPDANTLALRALSDLAAAARYCAAQRLTIAGMVYGDGAKPSLRVAWRPQLDNMVAQGTAFDDGGGVLADGTRYRMGHILFMPAPQRPTDVVQIMWRKFEGPHHD